MKDFYQNDLHGVLLERDSVPQGVPFHEVLIFTDVSTTHLEHKLNWYQTIRPGHATDMYKFVAQATLTSAIPEAIG